MFITQEWWQWYWKDGWYCINVDTFKNLKEIHFTTLSDMPISLMDISCTLSLKNSSCTMDNNHTINDTVTISTEQQISEKQTSVWNQTSYTHRRKSKIGDIGEKYESILYPLHIHSLDCDARFLFVCTMSWT